LKVPVLAGTAALFSGAGVWDTGFSGAAGVACPGEADAGSGRTSGTVGSFPLFMSALLLPVRHPQQFQRRWRARRCQEHLVDLIF
jgi:hypothetical protein